MATISPEALERLRAWEFDGQDADDLRALLDAHDTARAEGVAAERARVVADLRTHLRFWRDSEPEENLLGSLIDRYERGEHNKEGT